MNSPDRTTSGPSTEADALALSPSFALALARRYVLPPLILSLVVSTAAVTSCLVLAVPLEGEIGTTLNPLFDRFLGNEFSAAIVVVFVAAAIYALLQHMGVVIDRKRLLLLDSPSCSTYSSWLALLSGRCFRPDDDSDALEAIISDDSHDTAERYGLQRCRYVEQGLTPLRFVVWVLPLLGFIGTVVGIAGSISGLESVISNDGGGQASEGLITVLDGLRFAFDTTLLGLATVIPIMALLMSLERREDALTGQGRGRVQTLLAGAGMAETAGDSGAALSAPVRTADRTDGPEA